MQNIHQRRAKGPAYNIDSCDLLQTSPRNSHRAAPWTRQPRSAPAQPALGAQRSPKGCVLHHGSGGRCGSAEE